MYNVAMIELPIEEIASLCKHYAVKRLWVFGSAVSGEFDSNESDIDFLVEYLPGTDLGAWLKDYQLFKEELEALLGRCVDIVEKSSIKNPYFLRNISAQEQLLYAA